jgi:hypothetical protein
MKERIKFDAREPFLYARHFIGGYPTLSSIDDLRRLLHCGV